MRPHRFIARGFAAFAGLVASHAAAEPLPFSRTLSIGHPAHATQVALRRDGETIVGQLAGGPEVRFDAHSATEVTVTDVPVGRNAAALAIRTDGPQGSWTTLLGGPRGTEIIASGRSDLHGDPGERRAYSLILEPAVAGEAGTKGSEPSARWAVREESATACGTAPVPLLAQRVDPKTMRLHKDDVLASLVVHTAMRDAQLAEVAADSAAPVSRPLAVASSMLAAETGTPQRPSALVDGDPASHLALGRHDFAQLKWPRSLPAIESLEIQLAAGSVKAGTELWLQGAGADGSAGDTFRVRVPTAGSVVRVMFASPWNTGCLALGLLEGPTDARVEVAEVRVYSALDRPEFVAALVGKLAQEGPDANQAASYLAELGARGAAAVAPRFAELSVRGKQRALKSLARGLDDPSVRVRVEEAAHAPEEALSQAAMLVMLEGGSIGRASLEALAREPNAIGDRAAKLLATRIDELPALIAALVAEGGADRPVLRQTVVAHAKRDPASFEVTTAQSLGPTASASAKAAVATVAALAGDPTATERVAEALAVAERFEDRFRLAQVAAQVGASEVVDRWLERQASDAVEWMMRHAAFAALSARKPERAELLATRLSADAYPRVRAVAVAKLAKGSEDERLLRIAKDDPWPLVRVAGTEALAGRPELGAALVTLLDDPSRRVRAAAIDALRTQRATARWSAVEAHLSAAGEWTEVREAAVRFARELCVQAAREPLVHLLRRSLRPDATEDDQFLGARAAEALHALGGAAAADASQIVTREGAPPGLQKLMTTLPPAQCAGP